MKYYDPFIGRFHYYKRENLPTVRKSKVKIGNFTAVSVSGYCVSERRFFYNLRGCIGDVSCFPEVKVWPFDKGIGDGKLWFNIGHARVEVLVTLKDNRMAEVWAWVTKLREVRRATR